MISASCHTMPESYLTASTLQSLLDRAKVLGRTHFACTDLGYLYSSLKAYNAAKKMGIKPILGMQFYFKDPMCDIVSGTKADRSKYFIGTIYAEDQAAYQALVKLVSRTDFATIMVRDEKQNLFTWTDLETLARYKTNLVLGGESDIVGKAYLTSDANVGLKLFDKLNRMFPGRLRVAMIAEPRQKNFARVVKISYADNTYDAILSTDVVSTDRARKIPVTDLIDKPGHTRVLSKVVGGIYSDVDKAIVGAKVFDGFLPLPFDVTLKVNKFLKILAERYSVPVLVSDYAYYSNKEDKPVQNVVLENKTRIAGNQHMKSDKEFYDYLANVMVLPEDDIEKITENNAAWAKLFDNFELKYEWHLASTDGQDPLKKAMEIIKRKGRMKWDDPVYVDRLKMELQVIAKNGIKDLTPYFLPIVEVLDHYTSMKQLTSPGRGSAGGSLFCFLLGITNLDPIRWDLPFSRFFSKTRIEMRKLPDIDTDLPQKETLVGKDGHSGFLYGRWGNCVGHVSTRQTVRLRSAIKDVTRYFDGSVSREIEKFTSGLPLPPQGIKDLHFVFGYEDEDGEHVPGILETNADLQKYVAKFPERWAVISKAMGVTRAFSRHACAYVISDIPIADVLPTKEGYITHYEHKEVEAAGLVKIDFLTIKQLLDIQVALELINKRNGDDFEPGYFMHDGVKTYIWDLPICSGSFKSIWDGNTVSLFQINSTGMSTLVKKILPQNIPDLASILALERPGPKDYRDPETGRNMVEEFVMRRSGESQPDIQELADILPESYGTLIFQEDLGKVAKKLAGFSDEDAELLRENMAKKKMVELTKIKPLFIGGASKKVSKETAEKIWEQMVTFGRYGFSIIHSYEYAMITYACIFLRHNYKLDWWASVLSNADSNEITGIFWPYVKELVTAPEINLSGDLMTPDYSTGKIRSKLGLVYGMGEITLEPIIANRPYRDIQDFVDKDVAGPGLAHKLIYVGIMDSLFKPGMSLVEKLKAYEDAAEIKKFRDKKADYDKNYKNMRALQPKEGKVPEAYLNLSPLRDIAMKKAVLPTLPVDLHDLGCKFSKCRDPYSTQNKVIDPATEKSVFLVDGVVIKRIDALEGFQVEKDICIAATCYIIDAKEFSYAKGAKTALKLTFDSGDGNIMEKVLWPDYQTAVLSYPLEVKKGSICTLFLKKRKDKDGDSSVTSIVVEG